MAENFIQKFENGLRAGIVSARVEQMHKSSLILGGVCGAIAIVDQLIGDGSSVGEKFAVGALLSLVGSVATGIAGVKLDRRSID